MRRRERRTVRSVLPASTKSSSATPRTPKKVRRRSSARGDGGGASPLLALMPDSPLPDDAAAFLTEHVGEGWTVRPLAGDASVRRYFRVILPDGTTSMLAYYPA